MKRNLIVSLSILLALGLWMISEHDNLGHITTENSSVTRPIVIYTTDWCNFCVSLRATLKQYQINYHDYDVEHSEKGRRDYKKLRSSGVPIIIIGNSILHGYDGQELTDALVDNGYEIPTTWD